MASGLTHLSEDDLGRLRSRIEQVMRNGTPEQRSMAAEQLEGVDLERERRLAAAPV